MERSMLIVALVLIAAASAGAILGNDQVIQSYIIKQNGGGGGSFNSLSSTNSITVTGNKIYVNTTANLNWTGQQYFEENASVFNPVMGEGENQYGFYLTDGGLNATGVSTGNGILQLWAGVGSYNPPNAGFWIRSDICTTLPTGHTLCDPPLLNVGLQNNTVQTLWNILDNGYGNATINNSLSTNTIRILNGSHVGYVLTSNAAGYGLWTPINSIGVSTNSPIYSNAVGAISLNFNPTLKVIGGQLSTNISIPSVPSYTGLNSIYVSPSNTITDLYGNGVYLNTANQFYVYRQPDVLVEYSNGLAIGYNATSNTNTSRGLALLSAIRKLTNGASIYLKAEGYNTTSNVINLSTYNNIRIYGAGKSLTRLINNNATVSGINILGGNSTISDPNLSMTIYQTNQTYGSDTLRNLRMSSVNLEGRALYGNLYFYNDSIYQGLNIEAVSSNILVFDSNIVNPGGDGTDYCGSAPTCAPTSNTYIADFVNTNSSTGTGGGGVGLLVVGGNVLVYGGHYSGGIYVIVSGILHVNATVNPNPGGYVTGSGGVVVTDLTTYGTYPYPNCPKVVPAPYTFYNGCYLNYLNGLDGNVLLKSANSNIIVTTNGNNIVLTYNGATSTTYTGNAPYISITGASSNIITFNSLALPSNTPYKGTNAIYITGFNVIYANVVAPITNTSNEIGLAYNTLNFTVQSGKLNLNLLYENPIYNFYDGSHTEIKLNYNSSQFVIGVAGALNLIPYSVTNGIKLGGTSSNIIYANVVAPITNTSNEIGLAINSSNLQILSNSLSVKLSGLPSNTPYTAGNGITISSSNVIAVNAIGVSNTIPFSLNGISYRSSNALTFNVPGNVLTVNNGLYKASNPAYGNIIIDPTGAYPNSLAGFLGDCPSIILNSTSGTQGYIACRTAANSGGFDIAYPGSEDIYFNQNYGQFGGLWAWDYSGVEMMDFGSPSVLNFFPFASGTVTMGASPATPGTNKVFLNINGSIYVSNQINFGNTSVQQKQWTTSKSYKNTNSTLWVIYAEPTSTSSSLQVCEQVKAVPLLCNSANTVISIGTSGILAANEVTTIDVPEGLTMNIVWTNYVFNNIIT